MREIKNKDRRIIENAHLSLAMMKI